MVQSDAYQFRLEVGLNNGTPEVRLVGAEGGPDAKLAALPWGGGSVVLAITADDHALSFWAGPTPGSLVAVAQGIDGRRLSTERAGGFVGTLAGVFATGGDPGHWAEFDWFELSGTGREIWD